MRSRVIAAACALGVLALGPRGAAAQEEERPNLVLIVADDLGRAELGSYGQAIIRTPSLDELARRSARFAEAYSSAPVCAPSRCAILTGLHAGHCAVTENDEPNLPLASRDPTIAELLSLVGYRGAMVGKWALGGELDDGTPWNVQSAPWRVGFTDVLAVLDQDLAQMPSPPWLWRAARGQPARIEDATAYAPGLYADRAIELVRTLPEPFFLYFPTTLPHRELVPPPGSGADPADADATYRAMVERLDQQVGALLEAIDARGLTSRTLVVFTSDNGPNAVDGHRLETFGSSGGLRGQKRDLYEGGLRVPLLVAGPGVVPRVIDEPVALTDLLPTLTSVAGAPTPLGLDGRSLAPLLASEGVDRPGLHEHLYFECNERRGGAEASTRQAVRRGRWKWVRVGERGELYDLEVDPGERTDLAAREPAIAAELEEIAAREGAPRGPVRAPVLRVRAGGEGSPRPLREDAPTPLLLLHPDDIEDDERTWPQRIDAPSVLASLVGAEVVRGDPGHVLLDGDDRIVVPSDPALAVFGGSFSVRARVRLSALARAPAREERQWLLLAKPTGAHDVFASFGLLVQAGDLGCPREAPDACDGREIALFFGDPRLDPARPLAVLSTLRIEDAALHDLRVVVDRAEGIAEVMLDDRREVIPFLFAPGIASEAPIVIGAHHDASGRFAQGLRGELHRLAIAEGVARGEELTRLLRASAPHHVRVELGEIVRGADVRVPLALESVLSDAHWMRVAIVLDEGVRGALEDVPAVLFGGETHTASLRLDTSREGRLHADLTVRATRGRTGSLVEGAPVRVHLRARVVPDAAVSAPRGARSLGLLRGLSLGLVLASLVAALLAWRGRAVTR